MRNFMVVFLTLFIAFGFGCKKADVIGPEITNFQGNTELESSISLVLGEVFEKPKQKGSITEIIKLTQSTPRTLLLMPGSPSIKALDTDNDDLSTLLNEYENDIIRQYPHLNRFKGRLLTLQINPQVSQEGINTVVFKTIPDKVVRKRGYYNGFDKEGCVIKAGKKELDNASLVIGINEDLIIDYRIKYINEAFGIENRYTQQLDNTIDSRMALPGTKLNNILLPEDPIGPDLPEEPKDYTMEIKAIRINDSHDIEGNPDVYYLVYGYKEDYVNPTPFTGGISVIEGLTAEERAGNTDFLGAVRIDRISEACKWYYNMNIPLYSFNDDSPYKDHGFTVAVMDADWASDNEYVVRFAREMKEELRERIAQPIATYVANKIVTAVINFIPGASFISKIETALASLGINISIVGKITEFIAEEIICRIMLLVGDATDDVIGVVTLIDPINHLYAETDHTLSYENSNKGTSGDVSVAINIKSNIGYTGYQLPEKYHFEGTPPYALNAQRERIEFPPGCEAPLKHWYINLTWAFDFSAGQDVQFIIERAVGSPDGDYIRIGATDFNHTSYQDRSAMDDTIYYYRIVAAYRKFYFNKVSQPLFVAVPTGNVYDDDGPLAP